jgi:hypothetical protein
VAVYLRTTDGRRILLDTKKATVRFEDDDYELTSASLDVYDFDWRVVHGGTYGEQAEPCSIITFTDRFTGLNIEIPFVKGNHERLGVALLDNGDRKRQRGLRRLLRGTHIVSDVSGRV